MNHISSVPDKEFTRPQTIDELKHAALLASNILYAVSMRLSQNNDDAAWQIVYRALCAAVDAHGWICGAKWIGRTGRRAGPYDL